MDYTLIAMIIALLSSGLMAAAAMGYLIHTTLTGMRDIQIRRTQLIIMLAKNIIEQAKQKSIRDSQNGQIRED
jgi:hypothetical protein|nr:MAG TPA: hypothetical protein [Caudoviricetes sp.]